MATKKQAGTVDAASLAVIALGTALVAGSIAYSSLRDHAVSADGESANVAASDASGDTSASTPEDFEKRDRAVRGRLFTDTTPETDSGPTSAEAKVAEVLRSGDGASVIRSGPAGASSAIEELKATMLSKDMLTPEALLKNPLRMGVEKREPFVLPEGADPLDPKVYGWEKDDDGHWIISYSDLSLENIDTDVLLDMLIYPDEYDEDEVKFPDRVLALDGEKVAITGYMIATVWEDKRVRNFMLVRDLMACCFGGNPEPDEWIDVTMEDEGAPYIQFIPVTTRGTFHIQGLADDAGYATGAFRMDAIDTREE